MSNSVTLSFLASIQTLFVYHYQKRHIEWKQNPSHVVDELEVISKYSYMFNPKNIDNLTAANYKSFPNSPQLDATRISRLTLSGCNNASSWAMNPPRDRPSTSTGCLTFSASISTVVSFVNCSIEKAVIFPAVVCPIPRLSKMISVLFAIRSRCSVEAIQQKQQSGSELKVLWSVRRFRQLNRVF